MDYDIKEQSFLFFRFRQVFDMGLILQPNVDQERDILLYVISCKDISYIFRILSGCTMYFVYMCV